jgi:hypothetical protein
LCYLESRTRDEAARQLGWSLRTLERRLEQGRKLLRVRLLRRGVSLSAALFAAALGQSASAAVPALLAVATVRAAAQGLGTISPNVATLTEEGIKAIGATKTKAGLALMFATALLAAGIGIVSSQQSTSDNPSTERKEAIGNEPKAESGKPKTDLYGDLLPPDALVRMGTVRLRQEVFHPCCRNTLLIRSPSRTRCRTRW